MRELLKTLLIILLVPLLFAGCAEDEPEKQNDFKIEFGSECGWCGGEEFITITPGEILYSRHIPCGENKGTVAKSRKLTGSEWNEIIALANVELIHSLEYNKCNVCVDGCDEILRITEEENVHELRYDPCESIEGIEKLQQKLRALLQEMNSGN